MMSRPARPSCKLIGEDGNVFWIIEPDAGPGHRSPDPRVGARDPRSNT
jgi:hypothetical protein